MKILSGLLLVTFSWQTFAEQIGCSGNIVAISNVTFSRTPKNKNKPLRKCTVKVSSSAGYNVTGCTILFGGKSDRPNSFRCSGGSEKTVAATKDGNVICNLKSLHSGPNKRFFAGVWSSCQSGQSYVVIPEPPKPVKPNKAGGWHRNLKVTHEEGTTKPNADASAEIGPWTTKTSPEGTPSVQDVLDEHTLSSP